MTGRWLFAFDFDYTIVDEDSDYYVFQQLGPEQQRKMRELYATGAYTWTDLVDMLLGELHSNGVTEAQLRALLPSIPFNPAMHTALELASAQGHEIVVISDANTVYIDEIAVAKGFRHTIQSIITNKGEFDETGRLRITRHTTHPPHGCPRCAANLCKGKELLEYVAARGPFDRIVYLGDGKNDFCPGTKLAPGRALEQMLLDPQHRAEVAAAVEFWDTSDDVLGAFTRLLGVSAEQS
nr:hypothetical protein HK105_007899 [Polyrhizophydium stewartii]